MKKNDLVQYKNSIHRVLQIQDDKVLLIDCVKKTMPQWCDCHVYSHCSEDELVSATNICPIPVEELSAENRNSAYARFNMIAGVLPFVGDNAERSNAINKIADMFQVSKQTIRNYLCLYLAHQSISVLAPKKCVHKRELTEDEKNMRWALNKFFYTKRKNSLQMAYTMMLKEKYCDSTGTLLSAYPSIHQFRYFYRKHKKMQTYYISRDGLKHYQRNNRPLVGNGIQSFAPAVGTAMLDSTICDIYLVNNEGNLIGRPILTACIDAYSGLCCGYTLSWEGGVYSLRALMTSVLEDKVELCNRFGITIEPDKWDCKNVLMGILVTDMGKEYMSENFEQITELGVTVINLPAYRPELKGAVEKFFDSIQNLFKPYLKGKGVVETDYQERGAHDYRKDACLTMHDFETIVLRCICHYNSERIVDNFPYTEQMISDGVKPYANEIWNYGRKQESATLIPISYRQLILTMLPRTKGTFSRNGLKVNKLRYHCEGFTEQYLTGGNVICAYNPDDVSSVWLLDNGDFTQFDLLESSFDGMSIADVETLQRERKSMISSVESENLQAKIDLSSHIQTIAKNAAINRKASTNSIRKTRKREQENYRTNCLKGSVTK
jgi:transposase InsO family protein